MTEAHDHEIVRRELNTDREEPAVAIAEVVAELEGKPADELTSTYDCIDGMISELYSNPPSPEAQMTVEFTYSGYRITVEQSGTAEFVRVS
ncbi:HalOD1 output domain-containing protein [Haloarchaeobius litoreus]|uniref:HalOD1 output domain-containing protein n=1 Tax=Haloarchaeobius litoreus TaxID=755306 RepID=A0ABD6DNQ7_9EURY|nr:HalOD1 output domain-containing protein [Haloarchaeobius litoreus]